jgi:cell wall-associated NlpC family hydrolase
VDQQISNASAGHENVTVEYDGGIDGHSDSINNWVDVLGVYAVKTIMDASEPSEVATVTEEKKQALKDIYWDMNAVSVNVTIEMVEETDNEDETTETVEETTVHVGISSEDYLDAAERYGFSEEQSDMLNELMASENRYLFIELIGTDCYDDLTSQEIEEIRSSLPDNVGGDIVRYALTRLGDPYSKKLRGTDSYVDCSYLVRWAYQQAGVSSYTAATAAEQARYCLNNNMLISKDELQTGDVIFWRKNGCNCGRYMEIHHVAIYIGNGKIIEASSSAGCVRINDLCVKAAAASGR